MDLTNIFGGVFTPLTDGTERVDPPDVQLIDAISGLGITPPEHIDFTGKIVRFGRDKSSWYVAFNDGIPAAAFGDWREGIDSTWRMDIGRELSDIELVEWNARIASVKAIRDAEELAKHIEAASDCKAIYAAARDCQSHPYLTSKEVGVHCCKIASDGRLLVPLYDVTGSVVSLQYIDDTGNKRFFPGGAVSGNFGVVGRHEKGDVIYIAEGLATAASIFEATGKACVIAFSASNLVPVAKNIKSLFASASVVIVGDNDESGVGQKYAELAAKAIDCDYFTPPLAGDANDFVLAGGDLKYLLTKDSWLVAADDFCNAQDRVSWLITGMLQHNGLIMVHGASGSGKTFVVLDMALHLASGMTEWNGRKANPCSVVYLAGEGHRGLRSRIAAWKHHHGVSNLAMWVSKSSCDLDKKEDLNKTLKTIASLPSVPGLVVVDTLHRFMSGDENHSQDVKKILDACSAIQAKFNCSVLLVHHTGHGELAKKRGRGSSSWRGALDIEFSVEVKDDAPTVLKQIKNKDSEVSPEFSFNLVQSIVPNLYDEEGSQVYSAIIESSDIKSPIVSKHAAQLKTLERAWLGGNRSVVDGVPYITKTELVNVLIGDGVKESTATSYVKPSCKSGVVFPLLNGGEITAHQNGWLLANRLLISSWLLLQ